MLIIKLWGGLGNQLFQYAFGYALSKERNQTLAFDLSFYDNQPQNVGKRNIDLNLMNIRDYELFHPNTAIKILSNRYTGAITRNLNGFKIKLNQGIVYFKEPIHKYVKNLPNGRTIYFDGYWQSAQYFQKYKKDLEEIFVPKFQISNEAKLLEEKLKNCNSVAVHMRKGDFGTGKIRKVGHLLSNSYYDKALEYCSKNIKSPIFFVFTDNIEWSSKIIGRKENIIFINDVCQTDALTDLYLMSKCKHGIMSASTFSWWGNWLRNEQGIVIAPSGNYYNECFFDDDWIKL